MDTNPQPDARPLHAVPSRSRDIDPALWPHVHADYRTGLTYSKLSEKYRIPVAAITARRRAESWRRDLSGEVRAEVNARLAAESVPLGSRGDEEVIAGAATVGVEVVQRHRAALKDGITAARNMAADLLTLSQGQATEREVLGPKETLADAMLKVANSLARLIPQERIAYGLNEQETEKPYEERLREWRAAHGGGKGG